MRVWHRLPLVTTPFECDIDSTTVGTPFECDSCGALVTDIWSVISMDFIKNVTFVDNIVYGEGCFWNEESKNFFDPVVKLLSALDDPMQSHFLKILTRHYFAKFSYMWGHVELRCGTLTYASTLWENTINLIPEVITSLMNDSVCTWAHQTQFKCVTCERMFLNKSKLMVHLRTHTGEKLSSVIYMVHYSRKRVRWRDMFIFTLGKNPSNVIYVVQNYQKKVNWLDISVFILGRNHTNVIPVVQHSQKRVHCSDISVSTLGRNPINVTLVGNVFFYRKAG